MRAFPVPDRDQQRSQSSSHSSRLHPSPLQLGLFGKSRKKNLGHLTASTFYSNVSTLASDHRPGLLQTFPGYICLTHARQCTQDRHCLRSFWIACQAGMRGIINSYINPKRKGNAVEGSREPDLPRKTLKKPDLSRVGEAVGRASE